MRYMINPLDLPTRAGTTWQCCGDVAGEEEPSFLTFWAGDSLRGRVLDPGSDQVAAQIVLLDSENQPHLPDRIETPLYRVADRLSSIFQEMKIKIAVDPNCIVPALANEHACVMMAAVIPQIFGPDVPPATASRAVAAMVGLMEKPSWKDLPDALEFVVEKLADRPLLVCMRSGDVYIRPQGSTRKSDTVRIRRQRFPVLGTEWDWIRTSAGKGPLLRRQIDVLCGVAEILVKLGNEPLSATSSDMVLGNWLRMPRSVRLYRTTAAAA